MEKEPSYIAHVCSNSKLPKTHTDYCERGFIDEAPNQNTCSEQCWKYCKHCETKGYPVIKQKTMSDAMKLKVEKMRMAKNCKKELVVI
jgi:hypothetical protein